jgi:hypothetical protein
LEVPFSTLLNIRTLLATPVEEASKMMGVTSEEDVDIPGMSVSFLTNARSALDKQSTSRRCERRTVQFRYELCKRVADTVLLTSVIMDEKGRVLYTNYETSDIFSPWHFDADDADYVVVVDVQEAEEDGTVPWSSIYKCIEGGNGVIGNFYKTDGEEILTRSEHYARVLADFLSSLTKDVMHIHYYEPDADANDGVVDEYTGWWAVYPD